VYLLFVFFFSSSGWFGIAVKTFITSMKLSYIKPG